MKGKGNGKDGRDPSLTWLLFTKSLICY